MGRVGHIEVESLTRVAFDLGTNQLGVRLDKSEGAVKDKEILGSAEHRLLCQRG